MLPKLKHLTSPLQGCQPLLGYLKDVVSLGSLQKLLCRSR